MTKLSLAASRTLVGFGVVALTSTGSFAAQKNIENTPAGTNTSFTQSGNSYTWNGKDSTGAAVTQGTDDVTLTLSEPTTAPIGTPPKEVSSFNTNANSSVKINLQQNSNTALVAGDKLTIKGDNATDSRTLYNFDLNAGVIDIGDGTNLLNLEANSGESKLGTIVGQATTFKGKSTLTLKNNGSVSATQDLTFENGSTLDLQGSGSLKVGGSLNMTGAAGTPNILYTNPKNVGAISVGGNATFTNSEIALQSKDFNQLSFDTPKVLLKGGKDSTTLAGVTLAKDAKGNFNTAATAVADTSLKVGRVTLQRTAGDWLGRSISTELQKDINMSLGGTDSVTGGNAGNSFTQNLGQNAANTTTIGFVDYTSMNKVIYGQNANGELTKSNIANTDKTAALVNNGIYVQGNEVLLSSYLIKNVVNGKWVANINNMNSIIDNAATNLYTYRNTLTGDTSTNANTILDANGKVIDAKFQAKVNGGTLQGIYTIRDAQVTAAGGAASNDANESKRNAADRKVITDDISAKQNAYNTAQAAYNALSDADKKDPANQVVTAYNTATTDLETAKERLTTFDKQISLINEGKSLWIQAEKSAATYTKLTTETYNANNNGGNALLNGQKLYFKQVAVKDAQGKITDYKDTEKLNRAGINLIASTTDVGSHTGLAVGIFDSLQESGLSELARGDIMTDAVWNGGQRWKGLTNDTHNNARSVTNFTNSVSTAINVSNDMALGDRIARVHNPYGEKLAAAGGSDAYNDFYRRTNGSVWANAFGGANIVDGESGGVYGISLGADKQVGDSALMGVYFTYADADLKDKSAKQKSDNFRLGIYSNIKLSPSWELNLHGFGQLAQTDQYTSKLGEGYSSDFDKKFFGLSGSVGKIIDFENSLYLKPFVGLNYYYSNNPSYTEKGGSLPVNVNKMQNNSISVDVGLEARKYFNETSYLFATPKIEQYLLNDGDNYTASFVGSPLNFSVSASDKLKTYGQIVVGGSFGITDALNIELGLGAKQILANKVDDKNETYLSGNLGLKYKF
ncbi:autotransporter domain-containing protein [Helicobacter ganmani]|uniref:autotransporter family protein n=1 Tax=Helicobacter ganmani TaxID=60246 RepID=UPI003A89800D